LGIVVDERQRPIQSERPGIGLAVGQYLVDHEITMAGSDTWAVEAVPNPDASLAFPVHQLLIPRNGIYIFENLATEVLARDNAYEFAFFFAPLRLKGLRVAGNPLGS
jgi:kynurenine formamidase